MKFSFISLVPFSWSCTDDKASTATEAGAPWIKPSSELWFRTRQSKNYFPVQTKSPPGSTAGFSAVLPSVIPPWLHIPPPRWANAIQQPTLTTTAISKGDWTPAASSGCFSFSQHAPEYPQSPSYASTCCIGSSFLPILDFLHSFYTIERQGSSSLCYFLADVNINRDLQKMQQNYIPFRHSWNTRDPWR